MLFGADDNRLHYSLDFLEVGKSWLPAGDSLRIKRYEWAREEFELTPENFIEQVFKGGLLYLKDYTEFAHWTKLLAYPRLMTLKTIDMLMGELPIINAQADAGNENKAKELSEKIKDMRDDASFDDQLIKGLIDYSRFGVMLLRVYKCEVTGKAQLTAWNPFEWVPVFENDGTNRIKQNVIGWYEDTNIVRVQVHDCRTGAYDEYKLVVDGGLIVTKEYIGTYNKESKKPLFYAFVNTPTTTNPYGTNDYEIINGLLQKALERLTAILRVLDEHADPSMTGPSSLLEKGENGDYVFKTSKYYAVNPDEKEPKYLVWEANLESSFKAFDKLCEQIYTLSEMGTAFLGTTSSTGNAISGTAMRFKMISPLEKARRISNALTKPIKAVISAMMMINGDPIEPKDINITWRDPLPKDPRELAERSKVESGCNSIKPLVQVIMDNYGLDRATAESWITDIIKEQGEFQKVGGNKHDIDPNKHGSPMDPASDQNLDKKNGGADNQN